jgi:hypothetical protein
VSAIPGIGDDFAGSSFGDAADMYVGFDFIVSAVVVPTGDPIAMEGPIQ